ncbi:MAG: diguanylate cyclase, partial [Clostridia bacterium]|nr:diguanylate cyclase [Clostridia bacterium]
MMKQKILVVDDSEMNRSILADILGEDFEVIEACDGFEAINNMRSYGVELALVLLDIVMPRMDGFEVLTMMNNYKWIQDIPVIMISAENSSSYMDRAYELGATDYIQRPFDALVVRRRAINTIMLYSKQKRLIGLVEEQIYEKEKEQSLMINILSHIVEFRNGESGLHVLHIHSMTEIILQNLLKLTDKYKLTPQDVSLIATASALHDIGKIGVDDKILNKPGRLTPEEFEQMKYHAAYGAEVLDKMPFYRNEPLVRTAREICRWHHERYDGRGYPDGLKGDEIPISAQVVALADVYDALTSERVYKKAIPHEQAIEMITNGECGAFNPILLEVLKWVADKIQVELRVNSVGGNSKQDILRITKEVISHKELSVSKRTINLLEREREKYRVIAAISKEIMFEMYADPVTVSFFDESAHRLGVDMVIPNPLEDEKMIACIGKENMIEFGKLIQNATHDDPIVSYECDIKLDGEPRHCRILAMTQYNFNEDSETYEYVGTTGKIEDITEDYSKMKALERAATHDSLTGLMNRGIARDLIVDKLAKNADKKYLLAVMDMDDFKGINDTYGHAAGDEALKAVSAKIQKVLPADGIAARIGGDEFMIFWECT